MPAEYLDSMNEPVSGPFYTDADGVRHPVAGFGQWSDGALAAIGVFRCDAGEVPATKVAVSWSYARAGNRVTATPVLEDRAVTANMVNAERDRRIAAGFIFGGKLFQSGVDDQKRIAGAGTLALGAIVNGAQLGNLRWHGGNTDFMWIAADNSTVTMDAQTVFAFGQAAAAWESAHVFAARALKDASPIPQNYADDAFWPPVA